MSNLATAPKRATSVKGPKAAETLYNELEYELALGEPTSEAESAGESALSILRGRFPGIEERARDVTHPPQLSRKASSNAASPATHPEGRRRRATSTPAPASSTRTRAPRASAPAPSRRPPSSSRRGGASRTVSRASGYVMSSDAGGEAASWGSVVMQFLLGGVVLSLGYLLLKKSQATSDLFTGLTNTVRAVVSPTVDPLNPHLGATV